MKQGDVVQRWENGGGGWFTNNNVYHVSGNVTEGDDLIDGQPVELYYSDPSSPYLEVISKEESKADDQLLQDQIDSHEHDSRYLQLSGGTLKSNATVRVDQIEPVDQERYIRYEAGRDKRYPFALANCGMVQDVSKEIFAEEIAKIPAPESKKSRITTQVRTMFSSQVIQGKASFIDRNGNRQFRPDNAVGIEYTISRDNSGYEGDKDWWRDDYEPLDTGYIQVIDPFVGAVRWAAGIGELTVTGDTIRWMASGSIYTNFPDWNSDLDYFLNLNGCLREK